MINSGNPELEEKWLIHLCGPAIYRFDGVTFEIHSYFGPWPLKRDGSPKRYASKAFWALWERFKALPAAEQERYRCC